MQKKIIWLLIPVFLIFIWLSFSGREDQAYLEQVKETIEERKKFLKTNDESPFIQHDEVYKEPDYFEIDADYRVYATVERVTQRKILSLPNSTSGMESYEEYAWLHFKVKGQSQKLLVLKPYGFGAMAVLFCAFTDETSADQTYGGGRYLDIEIGKSNKVVLDFNLAYNPYCAYTDKYSCPLPPKENHLTITVLAGEKSFH